MSRAGTRFDPIVKMSHTLIVCLICTGCVSLRADTEEVSFRGAGDVVLRGTLALPKGAASPVPGVVVLHGAERATKKGMAYKMHANVFLERGMAVLLYDKRGVGESGGSYEESTYAQLIGDGVAAVARLREHPLVDASRIGLLGTSESGWLTPEIAERSGDIAFVINKVGASVSVRETVAWEVYNELLADGVAEESAREQMKIYRRLWAYRISPAPEERVALEEALALWANRRDSRLPTELVAQSESYVEDLSYDPTPFLERVTIPMLYVYGRADINIPTEICVSRLKELAAAGRPVTFHVFEDEGHELGGPSPRPPFYRLPDGYPELLGDFAARHMAD